MFELGQLVVWPDVHNEGTVAGVNRRSRQDWMSTQTLIRFWTFCSAPRWKRFRRQARLRAEPVQPICHYTKPSHGKPHHGALEPILHARVDVFEPSIGVKPSRRSTLPTGQNPVK